jgi:hypothetical protein
MGALMSEFTGGCWGGFRGEFRSRFGGEFAGESVPRAAGFEV